MTKRLSLLLTVTLSLTTIACTYSPRMPPEGQASQTQTGATKGTVLVDALPAGVEGLEFKDGELRLQAGYEFVEEPNNAFAVIRKRDGQKVSGGGCGCSKLGLCQPASPDKTIIICQVQGLCIGSCGLAVTAGGVSTNIIMY